ncbi:MAG: hypothetical protein LAO31_04565 [Acidobacteriia bacterium]|nr:hypothetical protein [Terriglobia bacterium]
MKKLFLLSLILAVVLAAGWEVLSYYESNYTGLVLYGHLMAMDKLSDLQTTTEHLLTQPENKLVVMRFEGKPKAPREIDFYTAKLIDTQGGIHKLQTAIWNESTPTENLLVFAVPEKTDITSFQYSDQPVFPIAYFDKFAWLRFRNLVGGSALTMIALACVFGIVLHFKPVKKPVEHVDPFDYINKAA